MLTKLDKYIIGKYLGIFFFVALAISLIAGVVDFSDHIDDFMRSEATFKEIVLEYYLNYFPFVNGMMWSLYALVSVIFFTSRMAYNSEIISILNAGVSYWRLMRPYMIAAFILVAIHLVLNTMVIPIGNKVKTKFENTHFYHHNDVGKTRNVHMFISPNSKIYIKRYIKRDSSAREVMIEEFENSELKSILTASSMKYKINEGKKWIIQDYVIRTFNGLREEIVKGTSKDTTLNLLPEDFVSYDNAKDAMTSSELNYYINRRKSRGAGGTEMYEVEYHRRWAEPATLFILTIIGMSLASRKIRGGISFHLALGLGLGAVYILMFQFSKTFVINSGLSALAGVWTPTVVFAFVAMFLVSRAQK